LERWCKLCPVDMTELPIEKFEEQKEFTRTPADCKVSAV
jgi:hypothetical protein